MPEFARLTGGSDCFELEFVEREATPEPAMKSGSRFYTAGFFLSDTTAVLASFCITCACSTVYN